MLLQKQTTLETENAISLGNSSRTIEIVCSLEEEGVENLLGLGTEKCRNLKWRYIYYNNGVNINNYGNQANEGISDRALEKEELILQPLLMIVQVIQLIIIPIYKAKKMEASKLSIQQLH